MLAGLMSLNNSPGKETSARVATVGLRSMVTLFCLITLLSGKLQVSTSSKTPRSQTVRVMVVDVDPLAEKK